MAAEWIKMRVDLYRDPRVCMIADALMDRAGALARSVNQIAQRDMTVTRNVMRNVTVGALVSVWGVMRTRGKRCGDDLIYANAAIAVLDDIADLPGFGEAMESAGWVDTADNGLIFRNFFNEYNTDPADHSKAKAAERQRRFRNAHHNVTDDVTRNVTVTHREEKRREEKKEQKTAPSAELFDGIPEQVVADFKALRAKLRAPITATAMDGIKREAAKAGITIGDALRMCCERGWRGFKAEWLQDRHAAVVQITAGTPRRRQELGA